MFRIERVRGDDDGAELSTMLAFQAKEGFKLNQIIINSFSEETKNRPNRVYPDKKHTADLQVTSYLCIFEQLK